MFESGSTWDYVRVRVTDRSVWKSLDSILYKQKPVFLRFRLATNKNLGKDTAQQTEKKKSVWLCVEASCCLSPRSTTFQRSQSFSSRSGWLACLRASPWGIWWSCKRKNGQSINQSQTEPVLARG